VALARDILEEIARAHPRLDGPRRAHELGRRLITRLIEGVIGETARRLRALAPRSADEVRRADAAIVAFSAGMAARERAIKRFLLPRMDRHARVARSMADAEAVVCDLFARYAQEPQAMPVDWGQGADQDEEASRMRRIADFIAGMTDRYALVEHARLFSATPD